MRYLNLVPRPPSSRPLDYSNVSYANNFVNTKNHAGKKPLLAG